MKAISIMYHDVVERGAEATSGFSGADADLYKIEIERFEEDLAAIAEIGIRPAIEIDELKAKETLLFLTFDDGGRSAYSQIADALERRGWRGYFFIPTDFIDEPTFMTPTEIRELSRRGHIIGSHSASHPLRMTSLSAEDLRREWRESVEKLSEILDYKVEIASVPGGLFSRAVAEAASDAGIKQLFTSEPMTTVYQVGNTTVFGRYTIQNHTPSATVAAIARGELSPRMRQYLFWNFKKILKKIGGENYLKIRKRLLSRKS